ncbi:MAG: LPXTG cell wall anchor domain-containing protein [Chloroflexota bacterium]
MSFENLDLDDTLNQDAPPPVEESSNRTFLIIAAALGGIALLALVCIAVYALVLLPRSRAGTVARQATLDAQQTEVEAIVQQTSTSAAETAIVAAYTATPTNTPVPPTPTITLTPTPVVAQPSAPAAAAPDSGGAPISPDDATATARYVTLEAIVTMNAMTATARGAVQPTAMPQTGFADEVGLPVMLGLAVLLAAVIFLARKLRTA